MPLVPALLSNLTTIHTNATATGGMTYCNPNAPLIRALVGNGMLQAHPNAIDPTDAKKIGFTVTDAGKAELGATAPQTNAGSQDGAQTGTEGGATTEGAAAENLPVTGTAATATTAKTERAARGPNVVPVVHSAKARMALPTHDVKRGGTRGETYPFGSLGEPNAEGFDSFFVARTDTMPDPYTTMRAGVHSANKRYAAANKPQRFELRKIDLDTEFAVAGARVFRVA